MATPVPRIFKATRVVWRTDTLHYVRSLRDCALMTCCAHYVLRSATKTMPISTQHQRWLPLSTPIPPQRESLPAHSTNVTLSAPSHIALPLIT